MNVQELLVSEYNSFYATYIDKVPQELDLVNSYQKGKIEIVDFFGSISEQKSMHRYAEDKWSIKEVLQHIIDNERIFTYRCLRIARRDKTPLAGYEQDDYVIPSKADKKSIKNLIKEYEIVRDNSTILMQSLDEEDLKSFGVVSGHKMSARAAAFISIGHEIHHIKVVKERYF